LPAGTPGAPLNLQKRSRLLAPFLVRHKTRLLDCGCGSGDYLLALSGHQIHAIGVEYSFEKARTAGRNRARVCQGDLQAIPFADGIFDVALLNEVLEHVPDEAKVLTEVRRVLCRGGRLVVFSPNRWYPFETHGVFLKSSAKKLPPYVPFVPYVPLIIGRRVFRYWARNYWHGELRALLVAAGFEIESRQYVWQTFENISGSQPRLVGATRPVLRRLAGALERVPFLRAFGVSQVLIARRR
jgi:ubiquinone/menaquinone biosynthesis C-methylase UbiE